MNLNRFDADFPRVPSRCAAWLLALGLAVTSMAAGAGTLRLGTPVINNNQYTFPVVLQGNDEGVAALDFRLAYDPAVFAPVGAQSGPNALQAQKQVSSNIATPGEFVIVMMGFNQNTVAPGEVVEVVLEKIGEPAGGTTTLRIAEPTLATHVGVEVDSRGLGRTVDFNTAGKNETSDDDDADKDPLPDEESPERTPVDQDGSPDDSGPRGSAGGGSIFVSSAGELTNRADAPNSDGAGETPADAAQPAGSPDGESVGGVDTDAANSPAPNAMADDGVEAPAISVLKDKGSVAEAHANGGQMPANSEAFQLSQETDSEGLITSNTPGDNTLEKEGRQGVGKYATLLLLAGGVIAGLYILLRVIGK